MNKTLVRAALLLFIASLLGCGGAENSDGSSKSTYSSCKITSSNALFNSDRQRDLQQCWDGVDFESKGDAMAWCEGKVTDYISRTYLLGHSVTYMIESTNCP